MIVYLECIEWRWSAWSSWAGLFLHALRSLDVRHCRLLVRADEVECDVERSELIVLLLQSKSFVVQEQEQEPRLY